MSLLFDPQDPFPLLEESSHSYAEAQAHAAAVDRYLGLEIDRVEAELAARWGWTIGAGPSAGPNPGLAPVRASGSPALVESNFGAPTYAGSGVQAYAGSGVQAYAGSGVQAYAGSGVQAWIGLPVQTLLTPYTELRLMLERLHLQAGQMVIDLGAAYGRMGFVMGRCFPEVWFYGYELVASRVIEAQRVLHLHGYAKVSLETQDLTAPDFQMREADVYFLYDFGTSQAIEKTLQDLRELSHQRAIRVVGRGRASRDAIERDHPWLSQVYPPLHFAHYSIYSSRGHSS